MSPWTTAAVALGTYPLSVIVKATVVLTAGLIAVHAMRRARASMRHLALASAFAGVVALPVAGLVVPAITVPLVRPVASPAVVLPITVAAFEASAPAAGSATASPARATSRAPALSSRSTWLAGAWAIGALVSLFPVLVTPARLRRLRRTSRRLQDGEAILRTLGGGGGRRIAVLVHGDVSSPLTCGVFRPAIVLPADAPEWPEDEIRRALVHELEHIRRADWPVHVATRAVCGVYWFHPLVWMAWRRLGLEAERACDDAVLGAGEPAAYAQQLVTLARRRVTATAVPVLSMAARTDLSARVTAVLDDRQPRGRPRLARAAVVIGAAALLTAAVAPLHAVRPGQSIRSQGADAPAFDVVSIRENTSGEMVQRINRQPGGRIITSNYPLRALVLFSYGLQPQQLVGGPDWINSARYDITAQASGEFPIAEPGTVGPPQLMMQRMLADRFQLAVHTETRELPIYALMVARSDRRLGPGIRRAAIDCEALLTEALKKAQSGGGMPALPQRPDGGPGCGMRFGPGSQLTAGGTSMAALARNLAGAVGRIVEDRTGLAGGFDFDLEFAPDPATAPPGAPVPPADPNAPSLFTALEEQLGLKLEATRAPVEVLVIDRVERPTGN